MQHGMNAQQATKGLMACPDRGHTYSVLLASHHDGRPAVLVQMLCGVCLACGILFRHPLKCQGLRP
eukprot:scaffold146573_cov18-Tisochrysis_lutea.AAC.2